MQFLNFQIQPSHDVSYFVAAKRYIQMRIWLHDLTDTACYVSSAAAAYRRARDF